MKTWIFKYSNNIRNQYACNELILSVLKGFEIGSSKVALPINKIILTHHTKYSDTIRSHLQIEAEKPSNNTHPRHGNSTVRITTNYYRLIVTPRD